MQPAGRRLKSESAIKRATLRAPEKEKEKRRPKTLREMERWREKGKRTEKVDGAKREQENAVHKEGWRATKTKRTIALEAQRYSDAKRKTERKRKKRDEEKD